MDGFKQMAAMKQTFQGTNSEAWAVGRVRLEKKERATEIDSMRLSILKIGLREDATFIRSFFQLL